MTTQQLYDRFQALYQEKSQRHFSTTWAVQAINDAVDELDSEVADVHPEYMGLLSATLSYTAGQQDVDVPAGLVEVALVEVTDLGGPPYRRLAPIEFHERGAVGIEELPSGASQGEPLAYYVRGVSSGSGQSKMGFVPIPARTASNNVLVWYHGVRADVAAIDATQTPDLPVEWHPLIPYLMCIAAAATDERGVLQYFMSRYNDRLARRLAQAIKGRGENAPEFVGVDDER